MMFHSVRDLSQASPSVEDDAVELGRERSESRPSVFTIRDFHSRQGRRAVIQLGFCVLANSRIRWYGNDRFDASLFSPLAKN